MKRNKCTHAYVLDAPIREGILEGKHVCKHARENTHALGLAGVYACTQGCTQAHKRAHTRTRKRAHTLTCTHANAHTRKCAHT